MKSLIANKLKAELADMGADIILHWTNLFKDGAVDINVFDTRSRIPKVEPLGFLYVTGDCKFSLVHLICSMALCDPNHFLDSRIIGVVPCPSNLNGRPGMLIIDEDWSFNFYTKLKIATQSACDHFKPTEDWSTLITETSKQSSLGVPIMLPCPLNWWKKFCKEEVNLWEAHKFLQKAVKNWKNDKAAKMVRAWSRAILTTSNNTDTHGEDMLDWAGLGCSLLKMRNGGWVPGNVPEMVKFANALMEKFA
jgi:hypothetical protein